jgi:hypothetical protein
MPTAGIFYFGPFNHFHYSPSPLYFPLLVFQWLSVHILISSTFTDLIFFFHSVGCLLALVTVSFAFQRLFSLISHICSFFLSDTESFEFYLGSYSLYLCVSVYFLLLPEVVSNFILRSLVHFELSFVQDQRQWSSFRCFLIQSATMCLLIGEVKPLKVIVNIERCVVFHAIFCFWSIWFFCILHILI